METSLLNTYLQNALTGNQDFRGQKLDSGYSCYGLTDEYIDYTKIIDLSSSTASQATCFERSDLSSALLSSSSIKQLINTFSKQLTAFISIPMTSGSDGDLHVSNILTEKFDSFSILTIGLEEAGRLCSCFLHFNIDSSMLGQTHALCTETTLKYQQLFDQKLNSFSNIPLFNHVSNDGSLTVLHNQINEYIHEQLLNVDVVVLRFNLSSKTGCLVPTIEFLEHLKQSYKDRLLLYMDACQTRNMIFFERLLDISTFISISYSKFYQVQPFAGCFFYSPTLSVPNLFSETLSNPFAEINEYDVIPINTLASLENLSGSALRFILGVYRAASSYTESDVNHIASKASEAIATLSESHDDLFKFTANDEIIQSPSIISFASRRLNASSAKLLYDVINSAVIDDSRLLVGQPVLATESRSIPFRFSYGYRSKFSNCDTIVSDTIRSLQFIFRTLENS